jgi:GR25 family glycosyltransferase involved in LPS biosynthesis
MNKFLGYFDDVYYINLDYREDRRKLFEQRSLDTGINAKRFSGIVPEDGLYDKIESNQKDTRRKWKVGCTLSHQAIVREAKERGLGNVLIFEDDCIFLDGFITKAQLCVNDLKEQEWDLMYFGGQPNQYATYCTDNLGQIKNGGIYSTHAYAINHSFYDKMLNVGPEHFDTIDILYLNYESSQRNLFVSKDILAIQDFTYSDLWDTYVNSQEYTKNDWDKYITQPLNKKEK